MRLAPREVSCSASYIIPFVITVEWPVVCEIIIERQGGVEARVERGTNLLLRSRDVPQAKLSNVCIQCVFVVKLAA